jgi:hypothetical protein
MTNEKNNEPEDQLIDDDALEIAAGGKMGLPSEGSGSNYTVNQTIYYTTPSSGV